MNIETASAIADAYSEHREAFGVPLTIGSEDILAIVNDSPLGRELVEGGFTDEGEVEAKVLLSDLSTLPSIGAAASYKSRTYRVARISIQPGGLIGEYSLRPAKR
jgi:hypothetical protein